MPTNTYIALDKVTVGTATPSIEFTGISSAYTDLIIVANVQLTSSGQSLLYQFNSDANTNYSLTILKGNGTSATSDRRSTINYQLAAGWDAGLPTSTSFATAIINVQNYSNSTTNKTSIARGSNAAGGDVTATVNLWRNNNAITSVKLYSGSGNLAAGSTFSLYGVKAWAAETSPKATGGYVYEDSTYYYHSFPFSGTFTPNQALTADCLVIAGGGGGGNQQAGGGGAGGLLAFTSQSLTATNYSITVGAGGAGSTNTARGVTGNDSQFGALTLVKGGGGGGSFSDPAGSNNTGATGGSGGGGGTAGQSNNTQAGGAATSGQGNAGGSGQLLAGTFRNGGGGGGAGGAGVNAAASSPTGTGGAGLSTYSSWATATLTGVSGAYAGGGGGGGNTRGLATAGGGNGATDIAGTSGTVSTGGGGGGGGYSSFSAGYAGGSGIVIVRYAK